MADPGGGSKAKTKSGSSVLRSHLLKRAMACCELFASFDLIQRAVATVTSGPARAARLSDRGVIEAGRRADLLRVRTRGDLPVVQEVWVEGRRRA